MATAALRPVARGRGSTSRTAALVTSGWPSVGADGGRRASLAGQPMTATLFFGKSPQSVRRYDAPRTRPLPTMVDMTLARLTRRPADQVSGALPDALPGSRSEAAAAPVPATVTLAAPGAIEPGPRQPAQRAASALRGGGAPRRRAGAAQAAEALSRAAAERAFAIEHDDAPFAERLVACRRALAQTAVGRPLLRPADDVLAEALALVAITAQRAVGLRPHLAQLTAAAIMLDDAVAELPAGEGHVLSLAVAACVRALAGVAVQIVLRHDALVADCHQRSRALFEALGLATAAVTTDLDREARDRAHEAAVVFTSAAALLQDHGASLRPGSAPVGFAGLHTVLLHEADRLLIDGARFTSSSSPLTLRELFRLSWHLGGVTATALEVGDELTEVYGLATVPIASIYPSFERDLGWRILSDRSSQQACLLDRVAALRQARRPVMILAGDRDECRELAALLLQRGIEPVRCDLAVGDPARQATASELAGRARAVSLHCQLDPLPLRIAAEPMARAAGGLALIVTTLGPSRRHDRHQAGRVGHQGEPGTVEAILDAHRPIVLAGWSQRYPDVVRLASLGAPQALLALAVGARRRQLDARIRRLRDLGRDETGPRGEALVAARNAALLPATPALAGPEDSCTRP